jgi:hypothetical protein
MTAISNRDMSTEATETNILPRLFECFMPKCGSASKAKWLKNAIGIAATGFFTTLAQITPAIK